MYNINIIIFLYYNFHMSGSTVVFRVLFLFKKFFLYFIPDKSLCFLLFFVCPARGLPILLIFAKNELLFYWFFLLFFSFLFHWFLFLPLLFIFFTFFGFILLFSFLDSSCGYLDSLRHFCFFNITSGEWKSQVPDGPALAPHLSDSRWGEVRGTTAQKGRSPGSWLDLDWCWSSWRPQFFPLVFD